MRQLNPLATELWERLEHEHTPSELVAFVVERYDVPEDRAELFRTAARSLQTRCDVLLLLDVGIEHLAEREFVAALVAHCRDELRQAMGITAEPVLARLHRWPAAMPQYHLGHLARVEAIERRVEALPGLGLAGGAYRGVGIADCVRSAEAVAESALQNR